MAIKYILTLKKECPPHLPINKFVELFKDDKELLPETRVMLESLRKARQPYVPLPLVHEVIISPEFECTLHRDLNPEVKLHTKMNWTEKNKFEYTQDDKKFNFEIVKTYLKMGYDITSSTFKKSEVEKIIKELDKKSKKMLKKLQRLGK